MRAGATKIVSVQVTIVAGKNARRVVTGKKLEFSQTPCQLFTSKERHDWNKTEVHTTDTEIKSLLQKSAIVECEHESGEYISPIFTTPKKDGSSRMILNLKSLNKFIEYHHFKMESFLTVLWPLST